MDASDAGRVVSLSNQIQTIQQALSLIDKGATIVAMTLKRPEPPAPTEEAPPQGSPTEPPGRSPDETEESEDESPVQPEQPESPQPQEPEEQATGDMTISTEGIQYPPQMLDSIRQQEIQLWRTAYDELAKLGVTNVPPPPNGQPQAAPAPAAAPQAARAARPAPVRPSPRGRSR